MLERMYEKSIYYALMGWLYINRKAVAVRSFFFSFQYMYTYVEGKTACVHRAHILNTLTYTHRIVYISISGRNIDVVGGKRLCLLNIGELFKQALKFAPNLGCKRFH